MNANRQRREWDNPAAQGPASAPASIPTSACRTGTPWHLRVKRSDFHFDLPQHLVAQAPLAERSASRLLVADPASRALADRQFHELPALLRAGDLLVFNDTRVLPARLHAHKESGGAVEILVERITGARQALVQLRASRSPRAGAGLVLADGSIARVLGREERFFLLEFAGPATAVLQRLGSMPLPPYIGRAADAADSERYQTVFAACDGAVAAPTAGLHFDAALLARLAAAGVDTGFLTLHVGAGTFQPVRAARVEDHRMHAEWLQVRPELVERMRRTRARGGRIIAVGTTVVRALESSLSGGEPAPFEGETRIFITPGHRIRSVDGLVTNFHLPESTLLMLVSAFSGREFVLGAYRHAIAAHYRFFSYGDAMLLWPAPHSDVQGSRDAV